MSEAGGEDTRWSRCSFCGETTGRLHPAIIFFVKRRCDRRRQLQQNRARGGAVLFAFTSPLRASAVPTHAVVLWLGSLRLVRPAISRFRG